MRIKTSYSDLRFFDTQCLTSFIGNMYNIQNSLFFAFITCFTKRHMRAYMNYSQVFMRKHHRVFCCMSIISIYLRMSGIMMPRHVDMIFIQCICYCRIHFSVHCKFNNFFYILKCCFSTHCHTFFVCCFQNICIHSLGKFLSIFFVKAFGNIHNIQIIYINDSRLKLRIFYVMNCINFQIFSSLYCRNRCFYTFCVTYDQWSAYIICFRFHQCFYRNLRTISRWISHCNSKYRFHIILLLVISLLSGKYF